ncbi:DNA cytosine methyltransferase [Mycoplasma sp. 1573]
MTKIRVFEAFAGVGAQHLAAKNVNKKNNAKDFFKIVATSDWDVRSNISYAAFYHNLSPQNISDYIQKYNITEQQIKDFINGQTFSLDSKKPMRNFNFNNKAFAEAIFVANKLSNNFPDITQVQGKNLDELKIDLFTYSFPCQGLSVANMGREKGIINESSTSHLIWQVGRILSEMEHKPKYLLLENVTQLVKKFGHEYDEWKAYLQKMGYKTFTTIIDAREHGSLQKRQRVFALSIQKNSVPKWLKNDTAFDTFIKKLGKEYTQSRTKTKERYFNEIFSFNSNKYLDEKMQAALKDTPSRQKYIKEGRQISKEDYEKAIPTVTTRQDRFPNVGIIPINKNEKGFLNWRLITPREAFRIMGFTNKQYNKLKPFIDSQITNWTALYRQAGNSIDVKAITPVFELIYELEKENDRKK